jgi:hypothetical protein
MTAQILRLSFTVDPQESVVFDVIGGRPLEILERTRCGTALAALEDGWTLEYHHSAGQAPSSNKPFTGGFVTFERFGYMKVIEATDSGS